MSPIKIVFASALTTALAACSPTGTTSQAPHTAPAAPETVAEVPGAVAAAPDAYSVLHEDERVRVVDMHLAAGSTDGIHQHPDEVVYFLTGGNARIELPDGKAMDVEIPAGKVLSNPAWTHTVTNTGTSELHAIIVELQQSPGSRAALDEAKRAEIASPDVYALLTEDERARVVDMKLAPGTKDEAHGHPDELVYFVQGGKAKITVADGNVMEVDIPDGHVLSNQAWEHTVENVGDTPIHAIIWELK